MDDEQKLKMLDQELSSSRDGGEVKNNEANRRFALDIAHRMVEGGHEMSEHFLVFAREIYQFIKEG